MIAPPPLATPDTFEIPPDLVPNYDEIVIEDGKPVDSIYAERQMRLLTEPLYSSWAGPGENRPFLALANVGVFYRLHYPPLVPDVMVSVDTQLPSDMRPKRNRSYFVWEYGRPPDVVIEIVSNNEGEETGYKYQEYAGMGVRYYVIYDPLGYVQTTPLCLYELRGKSYVKLQTDWLADVGLGLRLWQGTYQNLNETWLRWYNAQGQLIPTGAEAAEQERERAAQALQQAQNERARAEQERERAEHAEQELARLAAKLRELGIDPTASSN